MTNKKYEHSLVVVDGQSVQFSDLPHMMAIAMHPDGEMAYGAARLNLENELTQAVSDGLLTVRNRYGLGIHTFPHGDALQRAVLIPDDLKPFLNARGIELRITPLGNGPDHQTLENTAAAMQEQIQYLTTKTIAELFGELPFQTDRWVSNLSAAKWLQTAKRGQGKQGGAPATWCPLTIARLVYDHTKKAKAKQRTLKSLNTRFRTNPVLEPWKDAWDDYFGTVIEPGEA